MKEIDKNHITGIAEADKIYALLLVKHEDNTGDAIIIRSPESISEAVDKAAKTYPSSKIRVMERSLHKGYFMEGFEKTW